MSPRKNASSVICGSSGLSSETEYIDKMNEGATPTAFPYQLAKLNVIL